MVNAIRREFARVMGHELVMSDAQIMVVCRKAYAHWAYVAPFRQMLVLALSWDE